MRHVLEADGIELGFSGRKILSDIYIKCETGVVTGLLGRNGQGKTCLMQIIYGTLKPDIKSVRFDGRHENTPYKRSDLLTYVPQFNFIPATLTIERIFKDFNVVAVDFEKIFQSSDISIKSKIGSLSGGQRRLIELYVVITSKSKFVMLDEPFSHLSPVQIDEVKQLILLEKSNKGFLITDHMFRHVIDIADQTYLLSKGKLHLTTAVDDLEFLGYAHF
ncbi:ATP-binding cassette domain-containing protein [Daejeonella lutea]|uniref:ABC-type lipopolysaccharide export system, ATPase component n=1 Tax=Daejeonella lutea TaxID=572036 RepID=A0A1T5APT4_9SPHI|nr:ATP-binding cassette domain-containing protein [Daejeonella lutea]SKB37002.1 ABC-type lipopolysaccharide export system, ATPase component [Daejeonella lutea]